MGKKMTWEEMKQAFPNEWLMIVDYEKNEFGTMTVGSVIKHSPEKDEVFQFEAPSQYKKYALRYTGVSTFPGGLRSYATRHGI